MIFRHFSSIFKEITEIKQRKSYVDTLLVRPPVLKRNNEAIFCDEVTDSSPSIQACAGDSKARGGGPVLLDHELNEEELDQTSKVDSRDCEVNNSDSHCETLDLLVHELVDGEFQQSTASKIQVFILCVIFVLKYVKEKLHLHLNEIILIGDLFLFYIIESFYHQYLLLWSYIGTNFAHHLVTVGYNWRNPSLLSW